MPVRTRSAPLPNMVLYKPGSRFLYKGNVVTVDYIIIRRTGMWIRLVGHEEACLPEALTPL